jgi:hypothetical protein
MTTEIWQQDRPKGRNPYWAFRVTAGERVIFQSREVSVRLLSRDAAFWIARLNRSMAQDSRSNGAVIWKMIAPPPGKILSLMPSGPRGPGAVAAGIARFIVLTECGSFIRRTATMCNREALVLLVGSVN